MNVEEIWSDFTQQMTEIALTRSAVKATSEKELADLPSQDRLDKFGINIISAESMFFRDLITSEIVFYGHRKMSLQAHKDHIFRVKNKQYQWLLVEAYEAFERFLVKLYALLGTNRTDCWSMKDYGNITMQELEGKDFDWYFNQAKDKHNLPCSILKVIHKNDKHWDNYRIKNCLCVDINFAIIFIANLRHVIVHNQGTTNNVDDLINDSLIKSGIANQQGKTGELSERTKKCSEFARRFFYTDNYKNTIALLEVKSDNYPLELGIHHCNLSCLIEVIVSYSNWLVQQVDSILTNPN